MAYPVAAVYRLPLMYGSTGKFGKSFIQPMISALKQGNKLKLFTDEYRTPISGRTAAKGLLLAIEKFHGIYHLGGERIICNNICPLFLGFHCRFPHSVQFSCRYSILSPSRPECRRNRNFGKRSSSLSNSNLTGALPLSSFPSGLGNCSPPIFTGQAWISLSFTCLKFSVYFCKMLPPFIAMHRIL